MKTLSGDLTISKCSDGMVRISVRDELSRCEVIEVTVSLEEFGNALFSLAHRPCEFEFNDSGYVGMKRENKTEIVFVPDCDRKNRKATARAAVALLETDGWHGHVDDAMNMHNSAGGAPNGHRYRVHFYRYVPADDAAPASSEKSAAAP